MTLRPRPLAFATLLALGTTSGWADTTDYTFSGLYNTFWDGSFVVLPYTGSFAISGATATPDRPAMAPDVTLPAYAGIWAGSSEFYNGAHRLQITFANGATVAADVLDVVVNNTSFQGDGSPYPLGLSVQVDTRGAVALGMTASQVCPDGSVDDDCDSSGDDPLYRKGDASDLAVQHMTGVYFAFWGAPAAPAGSGVPDLAATFGAANGGLGIVAINALGQSTTTLTRFNGLDGITTLSAVPEPGTWLMALVGLAGLGLAARPSRTRTAA